MSFGLRSIGLALLLFAQALAEDTPVSLSAEASVLAIFDANQGSDAEFSGSATLDAGWASLDLKPVYIVTNFYESFAIQGQVSVPVTELGTFLMVAGNYESDREAGVFDIDYRDVYFGAGQFLMFEDLGPIDLVTGFAEAGYGRMTSRLKSGPVIDRFDEESWAWLAGLDARIGGWGVSAQISQRFADRDGQRQRLTDWGAELFYDVCGAAGDTGGIGCRIGLAHTDRDYDFHGTRDRLVNTGVRFTVAYSSAGG